MRYRPKLTFYDRLMSAAEDLTGYPDWETDRLSVVVRNYDSHCSVELKHNALTYNQDSSEEAEVEPRICQALDVLAMRLDQGSLQRVGVRRILLIPTSLEFKDLQDVFVLKFLSTSDSLRRILPERITDSLYRVDAEDELARYHIALKPVQKDEIPGRVGFTKNHHLRPEVAADTYRTILSSYPDVAVFVDLDLYKVSESGEISVQEARDFYREASGRIVEFVEGVAEYMFRTTVRED